MSHEVIRWHTTGGVGYATVKSGRSGKLYTVTSAHGMPDRCTCDAGQRRFACSHVRAVREHLHAALTTGAQSSPAPVAAPQPAAAEPLASPWPFRRTAERY